MRSPPSPLSLTARCAQYVLYVENVSSATRSADVKCAWPGPRSFWKACAAKQLSRFQQAGWPSRPRRRELEYAGPVLEVERDYKSRSALVEMKRCAQQSQTAFVALLLAAC